MRYFITVVMFSLFFQPLMAGWIPGTETAEDQKTADQEVAEAISQFKTRDPGLKAFFEQAKGYAVFPTVGKGGIGIGGAYGKGKVYQNDKYIGDTSLTQVTIGLQLGGQAYSEVIFFGTKQALENFKTGSFELGAQASAVAVTSGASADADYESGVAVFTMTKGGLMYEASIGGQKFSFTPR